MAILLLCGGCQTAVFQHALPEGAARPWNGEPPGRGADGFHFLVVGDRTGFARTGGFERGLAAGDLLQPAFMINVGDMIEGYSDARLQVTAEWTEMDARIGALSVPFFRVVGNHDIGNDLMRTLWRERYGPEYYAFVYRDTLFMVLSTEDPPVVIPPEKQQQLAELRALWQRDPAAVDRLLAERDQRNRASGHRDTIHISDAQVDWATRVLARHRDVRWTFVFLHRPAWEQDDPQFARIEARLANRGYTVFGGHWHQAGHRTRYGRDYVRLGTTGGRPQGGGEARDELIWVSMGNGTPRIARLGVDGIGSVTPGTTPQPAGPGPELQAP